MTKRLRAPDGLAHEAMNGAYQRTVCEHAHGDRWAVSDLVETDAFTTCLLCLVEPDRRGLAPYDRAG